MKLLLTDIDDSAVVPLLNPPNHNNDQVNVLDELLFEISAEIDNIGEDQEQLFSQLKKIENTIEKQNESLSTLQLQLNSSVQQRYEVFESKNRMNTRLREISELLARFQLLREHYIVDIDRLKSIQESGSLFFHIEVVACPICGSEPEAQHFNDTCNTEIEKIISSATSEINKINQLLKELDDTVQDLSSEEKDLATSLKEAENEYEELDQAIQRTITPQVSAFRTSFSELIEKRANINKIIETYHNRVSVDKYAYLASREEIVGNDYNLNIPRYVDTFEEEAPVDIQAVKKNIADIEAELAQVQEQMKKYLDELGL